MDEFYGKSKFEIESSVIKADEDKKLKGTWTAKITHSNWHWSGPYGWMWCGPWRPWTKLLEWWYNK